MRRIARIVVCLFSVGTFIDCSAAGGGTPAVDTSARDAMGTRTATYTVLHSFGGADGAAPEAGLVDVKGVLYGTTSAGGDARCGSRDGCGTVYSVDPASGKETVVHAFQGGSVDGIQPLSDLTPLNGLLYGTTHRGGSGPSGGQGVVFSIDPTSDRESIVHSFQGGHDGGNPYAGAIALGDTLYGTTSSTIYSVASSGQETPLHQFKGGRDGETAHAAPIAVDDVLYGTTLFGGVHQKSACTNGGCGVVFDLTTASSKNREDVVYRFRGGMSGANPQGALIDVDGILYGTTSAGGGTGCGGSGCGTIFSYDVATGAQRVVYRFAGGHDGAAPAAALTDVVGTLYGTTAYGGGPDCKYGLGCGTIFALDPSSRKKRYYIAFRQTTGRTRRRRCCSSTACCMARRRLAAPTVAERSSRWRRNDEPSRTHHITTLYRRRAGQPAQSSADRLHDRQPRRRHHHRSSPRRLLDENYFRDYFVRYSGRYAAVAILRRSPLRHKALAIR